MHLTCLGRWRRLASTFTCTISHGSQTYHMTYDEGILPLGSMKSKRLLDHLDHSSHEIWPDKHQRKQCGIWQAIYTEKDPKRFISTYSKHILFATRCTLGGKMLACFVTRLSKAEELYQEGPSELVYELPEIDICLDGVTKDGKTRISVHISFGLDSTISDQAKANVSDQPNRIG